MYQKKVTFSSNENESAPTSKQVYIPRGNYTRIIESKATNNNYNTK